MTLLLLLLLWVLRVIAPAIIVLIIVMLIHGNFCTCFHSGVPSPTENWGYRTLKGSRTALSEKLSLFYSALLLCCLRVSAPLSPHTHTSAASKTWRGIHDSTQWNKSLQIQPVIQYKHRCLFQRLHFRFKKFETFQTISAHYSKSQIFVQKFNFDKTPTFSRVFHPNFFDNFFREIKVVNS